MGKLRRLNRDVSDVVLSKLETRDLLKMKCVSRHWRTLLSDRSFRLQRSLESQLKLSGFFFQPRSNVVTDVRYISTQREVAKLPCILDFIPEKFRVMCSCNGLICCKRAFGIDRLAIEVGNPVTREWIKLDWTGKEEVIGMGMTFDPCVDISDEKTNFKVVVLSGAPADDDYDDDDDDDEMLSFHVYSSETGSWKRSDETCATGLEFRDSNCVSLKGVLYWLSVDQGQVLAFHVENEVAFVISAPIPASEMELNPMTCIGESNGVLQYVMAERMGLVVWVLEGPYYEEKWSLGIIKTLEDMENVHVGFEYYLRDRIRYEKKKVLPWMALLGFRDGVLVLRAECTFFLYNTVSGGGMERVGNVSELGASSLLNPTVLPYSMSLVPLTQP